jgi:serine/threonine protein kinase/tetratricopeptide (TPR) repeat protein
MPEPSLPEESIFAQALEFKSATERAAFLDRACGENQHLRAEVEALLRASQQSGDMLDLPENLAVTTDLPRAEGAGTVIGPYKLLEQIGEGGMGTVWMAEQTEPIQRRVALKVIKEGMDSRQVLARFEAERQALALMEHPNIAKVLDAGKAPSGRPYFVMELVKGQLISKYCDEKRLGVRERLELFGDVCRAVQHAHQKGIIHRDLKPSNVLVAPYDGKPVVKVIDFGVAKATGQRLTDKTLFTGFGALVGTPEYMSPEQAEVNNQDIDTRSDIYSLGVLLYELLTGSTPLTRQRIKEAALLEVLRVIREEEPPRPSTRLSESKDSLPSISAQRQTEPSKLTRAVRGELDWIVMKAIEKDRNRRYETANGFAMDIQRYLADEPVQAGPPSAAYRFRKFATRNRAGLTMALILAVALLLGIVATSWQAIRATRQRDRAVNAETLAAARLISETQAHQEAATNLRRARQAVDEYFTLVSESTLLDVPGLQPLRKQLLESALRYYQAMAAERADDAAALADLALGSLRVANIYRELDRNDDSLAAIDSAIELLERLRRDYPHATDYQRRLAGYSKVNRSASSKSHMPKDPAAAHRTLSKFRELWEAFASENPDLQGFQNDLASIYRLLAALEGGRGVVGEPAAFTRSVAVGRKAIGILEQLNQAHPEVVVYRENLADAYGEVAWVLSRTGQLDEARDAMARSTTLLEQLYKQFPNVPRYRAAAAGRLTTLASTLAAGQPEQAEKTYRQALQAWRELATDFPIAPEFRISFATTQWALGELLAGPLKRLSDGVEASMEGIEQFQKLMAEYPDAGAQSAKTYTAAVHRVAGWNSGLGRPKDAERVYRDALQAFQQVILRSSKPEYRHEHGRIYGVLGLLLTRVGRDQEAEDAHRRSVDVFERLAPLVDREGDHWRRQELLWTHGNLGLLFLRYDRSEDAEAAFRTCIALAQQLNKDFPNQGYTGWLAQAQYRLAWVFICSPKPKQHELLQAVELAKKAVEAVPQQGGYWGTLGVAYHRTGNWKEALAALDTSIQLGFRAGYNYFFLAMTHWQLGTKDEARKWYGEAVQWMDKYQPGDKELRRYRAEAEQLLGIEK